MVLVLSDETHENALSLAERGESGGENGEQKETPTRLAQQRERKQTQKKTPPTPQQQRRVRISLQCFVFILNPQIV